MMPTADDKESAWRRFEGRDVTVTVRTRRRSLFGRLVRPDNHVMLTIVGGSGVELRLDLDRMPELPPVIPPSPIPVRQPSTREPSERVRILAAQVRVAADQRARVPTPAWIVDLSKRSVGHGHGH
jgi:hypothetical protein